MGRQFPPAGGTGLAVRRANGSAFRPANFGAPLPSDGDAKGSKPTIWTEARRDAPRGNAPARVNACTPQHMHREGITMLKFAPIPLHVMPGLVPGIHDLLRDKVGVDGRDKPGHDER